MSDDESFVVLESSPLNSIEPQSSLTFGNNPSQNGHQSNNNENASQQSLKNNGKMSDSDASNKFSSLDISKSDIAASFILGDIQPEVIKESVYLQFPSLNESLKGSDDVLKLQNLITSNIEMKETLRRTNDTMSEWMAKTKKCMDDYKDQIRRCQEEIQPLYSENQQLREKMQHIEVMEKIRTHENEQLRIGISEKSSQILNMQQQILKLEQQQSSYDFLQEKHSLNEYVSIQEHNKVIEQLETRMSTICSENSEIKKSQSKYLDEINRLKVSLSSYEELNQNAKLDLQMLQNKEAKKSQEIIEYENQMKSIKEEIVILRIQVDTYKKDFESERCSRQSMAGERDNLLGELRKLQDSNQKLVEEAELNSTQIRKASEISKKRFKDEVKKPTQPIPSPNETTQVYERVLYSCPLCSVEHKTLGALQNHVQACLDDNN